MRATEIFSCVDDIQMMSMIEEFGAYLVESAPPRIVEDITTFLDSAAPNTTLSEKDIGSYFFPVILWILPQGKIMLITRFNGDAKLIDIHDFKYIFSYNGNEQSFPPSGDAGDMLKRRVVFKNENSYSLFNTMFSLKYLGEWKMKEKIL